MQVTYNDGKKEIKTLKQGTDYTVDSIDRETWDTVGSPNTVTTGYVTIRGIGNFKGSRSIEYRICPNISDSSAFNISINGKRAELTDSGLYLTYTGKALKPSMEIEQIGSSTVEAVEGEGNTTEKIYSYNPDTNRTLVEGTDYSVTYRSNIDAGDATVTATGKGELYGGSVSRTFHILPRDSKSVSGKPAYTKATYNGKSKTPSITCTYNGMTLSKGVDYKLSYESGRVKIGTYHIYVEYMGNYAGTKTLKFVINPKGTSVKKLAAGKRTVNVYWYKRSSENTSGYQIRYSRHSSMKDSHVRTVKGSRCYGKILKHLKSGTRYYVQVRVYKKTGGKTYYSDWSSKRSIKAK